MIKKTCLGRFTSLKHLEAAIKYGVFASHLEKVNDPFERVGIDYPEDYRICCMTTAGRKMIMWAYYTNHAGCFIEYDLSESYSLQDNLIREVKYEETLREHHQNMNPQQLYESLYYKSKEWKDEREIRAVYYSEYDKEKKNIWNNINGEIYLKANVKKVVFGLQADKDDNYLVALRLLKEYNENHNEQIEVKKCILNQNNYGITESSQYNYLKELNRLELKKHT